MTFKQLYLTGKFQLEDMDTWVDYWHTEYTGDQCLSEYLGFTDAEYALCAESTTAFEYVMSDKRIKFQNAVATFQKTSSGDQYDVLAYERWLLKVL